MLNEKNGPVILFFFFLPYRFEPVPRMNSPYLGDLLLQGFPNVDFMEIFDSPVFERNLRNNASISKLTITSIVYLVHLFLLLPC